MTDAITVTVDSDIAERYHIVTGDDDLLVMNPRRRAGAVA